MRPEGRRAHQRPLGRPVAEWGLQSLITHTHPPLITHPPTHTPYSYYASFPTGSLRTRFPVAAKMALHTAGAIGPTEGSPIPPCLSSLGTTCTSTTGISLMCIMG